MHTYLSNGHIEPGGLRLLVQGARVYRLVRGPNCLNNKKRKVAAHASADCVHHKDGVPTNEGCWEAIPKVKTACTRRWVGCAVGGQHQRAGHGQITFKTSKHKADGPTERGQMTKRSQFEFQAEGTALTDAKHPPACAAGKVSRC